MLKGISCEICKESMTTVAVSGLKVTKSRYPIVNDDGLRILACKDCFKKYYKEKHKVRQIPMYKDGKDYEDYKNVPSIDMDGEIKEREDEDDKV